MKDKYWKIKRLFEHFDPLFPFALIGIVSISLIPVFLQKIERQRKFNSRHHFSIINIQPGSFFSDGNKNKTAVSLTFDDGPGEFTPKVLDILDQYQIKATFFVNGDQVELRPKLAKEITERGHEIGDHTYSHINFYSLEKKSGLEKTKEKIRAEMQKSLQAIQSATGAAPKLCRMPHGYHRNWLKEIAKEFNVVLVNWTFGEDWREIPAEKMIADYLRHVRSGSILLFHDGGKNRGKTLQILPLVIAEAKKKNLAFLTVGEIIQ